tara:strand:+ start:4902 stop:5132 length:231 start_codon:yes stop_codon:yes gene_type:complete
MPQQKSDKEFKARLQQFAQSFAFSIALLVVLFCIVLLAATLFIFPFLLEPFLFYSAGIIIFGISISYAWSKSFADL